jgi:hypothetical protein
MARDKTWHQRPALYTRRDFLIGSQPTKMFSERDAALWCLIAGAEMVEIVQGDEPYTVEITPWGEEGLADYIREVLEGVRPAGMYLKIHEEKKL